MYIIKQVLRGTVRKLSAIMLIITVAVTLPMISMAKPKSLIKDLAPLETVEMQLAKIDFMLLSEDLSTLGPSDKKALKYIIEASKEIHKLFLYQMHPDGPGLYKELQAFNGTVNQPYLDFFRYNWSTWGEGGVPFINTAVTRNPGLNFYPPDMTVEEFNNWITAHPEDQAAFTSYFTVIQRDKKGGLIAVPYSKVYKQQLAQPSMLLKLASVFTTNKSLSDYLWARAEAFKTNDYRPSDVAWLNLDSDILVTIGPYETYADGLFEQKATFMAQISIVDKNRAAEVEYLESAKQYLLDNFDQILPNHDITVLNDDGTPAIAETYTPAYVHANYAPIGGGDTQFVYVNEIFSAGDYRQGAVIGFFLPNDPAAPNARNHIISNTTNVKIQKTLLPIAQVVFGAGSPEAALVNGIDFDNHTTLHEFGHSLEPQSVFGRPTTTVGSRLLTNKATMSEPTADLFGLEFARLLIEQGNNPFAGRSLDAIYYTDAASLFRSLRFGLGDSHARGAAIQIKHHMESGAMIIDNNGHVTLNLALYGQSVNSLLRDFMEIHLTGDYAKSQTLRTEAVNFVEDTSPGTPGERIKKAIDNIEAAGIPADFIKVYPDFD